MATTLVWWDKPLSKLSAEQWEGLCDGCGKCCLHKLEDEDSGEVVLTAVACRFLEHEEIRCRCYQERTRRQPECLMISLAAFPDILPALPDTCAYRLRWQGDPLPDWHPLKQGGQKEAMLLCGHSVRDRVISEDDLPEDFSDECWESLIIQEWSS